MSDRYWQLVAELEHLIAGHQIEKEIEGVEKLLNEYGHLEHSLYLKGVALEQQGLSSENSDTLHLVAKEILSSQVSTVNHLDNAFRWFYLLEDWDNCGQTLDRLLGRDAIPTSLPPGMYFRLTEPSHRALIRQLLDTEDLRLLMSEHPFINELKILFQTSSSVSSRCTKGDGPIVLLISDESIREHFDAINDQLRQLNYPTNVFNGGINGSSLPLTQTELQTWLNDIDPLAIFVQTPYIETLPTLWQPVLSSQPICVPGYGPHLSGDDFWWGNSRGQFGLSGYVLARYVFAANNSVAESFQECGLSSSQVILTGDPLSWSMRHDFLLTETRASFDLLWAPHWTSLNVTGRRRAYRNIERDIKLILKFADEGNSVCLRPHPLFAKQMVQNLDFLLLNPGSPVEDIQEIWEALISHKNVTLSTATIVEDCMRCKRLLTDGISIIFYWALTGKPIAISYRHDSPTFAEFATPLLNEIPKLLTEKEIQNWLTNTPTLHQLALIDRCNEILPDNQQSPIELFLEFATAY
jgi:hypothetical protein